jgi:hypothetical protein
MEYKMFFDFLYNVVRNIFNSKKNLVRYFQNCVMDFIQGTRYSCHILIKPEISQQILEIYSNIIFRENPSSVSRVIRCGRIDGQT